ncbi:hypothetical protein G6F65_011522 [Rhizopus arrhizus]|nr:hypothetical protein G6F65_011522 [Rhizopus arrhizus]
MGEGGAHAVAADLVLRRQAFGLDLHARPFPLNADGVFDGDHYVRLESAHIQGLHLPGHVFREQPFRAGVVRPGGQAGQGALDVDRGEFGGRIGQQPIAELPARRGAAMRAVLAEAAPVADQFNRRLGAERGAVGEGKKMRTQRVVACLQGAAAGGQQHKGDQRRGGAKAGHRCAFPVTALDDGSGRAWRRAWPAKRSAQQRQRVARAFGAVDAPVQVRRRALGVAAVAHVAEQVAGPDHLAARQAIGPAFQMRVVVAFARGPDHPDLAAAKPAFADIGDDARRGAAHRRTAPGEDVDTRVRAITTARRTEGVGDLPWAHALHRHRQRGGGGHPRECPQHLRCGRPRSVPQRQGCNDGNGQEQAAQQPAAQAMGRGGGCAHGFGL